MATQYMKTRRTSIEKWTDEDHARFEAIVRAIPAESYPNGNNGRKDNEHRRFLDAGFRITKQDHGDAYSMAWAYFDLA
jgi:hypothetical protein